MFFLLTPWRIIGTLFGLLAIGIPALALLFFFLALTGTPGSCEAEGRPIAGTIQEAGVFDTKWKQLNLALNSGSPSTATFAEGEATGRARLWVDANDVPVSELFLCFSTANGGQASGKIDVPFFPGDVDVLIAGTVDLTGEHPNADIEEFEVGGLPGPMTNLVEGFINSLIDDQEGKIDLTHDYAATFGDGTVTISGQP
ncbi:MAG: hypothetical protein WEE64_09910 [Dehalococcoidia bacterium]